MSEMESNQTDILITRYLMNDLEGNELAVFKDWMNQSEANTKLVEEYRAAWNLIESDKNIQYPEIDVEWNKLNSKIQNQSPLILIKPESKVNWKIISTAAAIFILVGLAIYQLFYFETEIIRLTGDNQELMVSLPDGSEIKLNHNSEVDYNESDLKSKTRKIFLKGEAFFEVAHDSNRPFIVETDNAIIQVIGTKFNIKTRNKKTILSVTEGKVSFRSKNSDENQFVAAGLTSSVSGKESPTLPSAFENKVDWLNNSIFFDHALLSEVAEELRGKFGIQINISTDKLNYLTVSGKFQQSTPAEIISSICISLNLRYKSDGNVFTISE